MSCRRLFFLSLRTTIGLSVVQLAGITNSVIAQSNPHPVVLNKFMGVASCASSNCHGGTSPRDSSNVLQNEYVTWSKNDSHSQAWVVLTQKDAQKIAANLGIAAPEKEPWCLECHATYVEDQTKLSKEFKIEDGVGCESCHGAASGYLSSHTAADTTHAKNLKAGLSDLSPLSARTHLCLDCHLGSEDASVNHRLMGAGHPRLSFELDTFSMLQPKHWVVDDDYRLRKGDYNSARAWLVGQAVIAERTLEQLGSEKRSRTNGMPEFTTLTCYTCHHSLGQEQWRSRDYDGHPGELRLNTASLFVVEQALRALGDSTADLLKRQIVELHSAFREHNVAKVLPAIEETVRGARLKFENHALDNSTLKSLLKRVAESGAKVPHLQYEFAEQIAMALSSILAAMPDANYKVALQSVYDSLRSPADFRAEEFTKACAEFVGSI